MMKICNSLSTVRVLAAAALLLTTTLGSTTAAIAASDPTVTAAAAAASSDVYLDRLLVEINTRRAHVGTAPLVYTTSDANAAVGGYLADLTPQMEAMRACFHGQNNPVAPAWDYVSAAGLDGEARGEVLACPDDNGFWTTARIADGWLQSPSHFASLYGDADINAVACGTYGLQRGGQAFQTIACVTYRI